MMEHIIGRWAVNGGGVIAKITGIEGGCYVGTTLGGQKWQALAPLLLREEYSTVLDAAIGALGL